MNAKTKSTKEVEIKQRFKVTRKNERESWKNEISVIYFNFIKIPSFFHPKKQQKPNFPTSLNNLQSPSHRTHR